MQEGETTFQSPKNRVWQEELEVLHHQENSHRPQLLVGDGQGPK